MSERRLRGYLSTSDKQAAELLAALETLVSGQPLYPALDWTAQRDSIENPLSQPE